MMTNNTVNPPKTPSMANRLAKAAAAYAQRANHNGGTYVARSGFGGSGMGAAVGGIGGAAAKSAAVGGIGGAVAKSALGGGGYQISSQAARETLERNHGKLGELMDARLRSQAGPVKP